MQEDRFREFLKVKEKQDNTIELYVTFVKTIDAYLKNEKKSLGIDKLISKGLAGISQAMESR